MNNAQSRHVKAMAKKMGAHAEAIKRCMQALQRNSLFDMPVELTEANFADSLYYAEAILQVYREMFPQLDMTSRETAWAVYLERADTDEKAEYLGIVDALSMADALQHASELYEYPAYDLVVKPAKQEDREE
jgi:hypothetical protein